MTVLLSILKLTLAIKWEITEEASAGLDFELLNSRLKDHLMLYKTKQQM
jgi:hypothetical protein